MIEQVIAQVIDEGINQQAENPIPIDICTIEYNDKAPLAISIDVQIANILYEWGRTREYVRGTLNVTIVGNQSNEPASREVGSRMQAVLTGSIGLHDNGTTQIVVLNMTSNNFGCDIERSVIFVKQTYDIMWVNIGE